MFELGIFLFGLFIIGPFVNFGIYAFAYFPRQLSPFQSPAEGVVRRNFLQWIPVLGWLVRDPKERALYGRWYWIRPFMIELLTPVALVLLMKFVLEAGAIPGTGLVTVPASLTLATLWQQYFAFAVLSILMLIATFIDFDERTIPDWITIPGTIIGLAGAVTFPDWRMVELADATMPGGPMTLSHLQACSPNLWNPLWSAGLDGRGLVIGLLIWSGWCFGLADRRWISRRGFEKAVLYFVEHLKRNPSTRQLIAIWIVGLIGISVAYWTIGSVRWISLLSSLLGIGLGGMLVWGFRLVARWAMGREALGFGDVTLMAMIGSFFGWQIVWIAFFLAPFFGIAFVLISWIVTRDTSTPFGPYLCAATLYAMLDWANLWSYCSVLFSLFPPQWILPILIVLLSTLGLLLWLIQSAKMLVGLRT